MIVFLLLLLIFFIFSFCFFTLSCMKFIFFRFIYFLFFLFFLPSVFFFGWGVGVFLFSFSFCNFYLFWGLFSSFSFCFLSCVYFFSAFGGCFSLLADWLFFLLCFFNLACKQTYDSWRLGHVVPEDVVIADIGDQSLDIFLHGPESTHKNGIGKTFTHTSISIQSCTLLKQTKSKTLNSPNMTPSISCPLPVQCGGRRPPESLADALQDWSTSEVFSLGQY